MNNAEMTAYLGLPFDWNAPATPPNLERAASLLEMVWPAAIRALYEQHDGASGLADNWADEWAEQLEADEDAMPSVPRLMPLEEVEDFYANTHELFARDIRFFWTDDNSNYGGVYVAGPLQGMVLLFAHDDPNWVPQFRSVIDFLNVMGQRPNCNPFDETNRPMIFPNPFPDAINDEQDWAKAQALLATVKDHNDGDSPELQCALALTPYTQSAALLPYLDSVNFYVAAQATEILGIRKYLPARPKLEFLAEHGLSNAKIAAQSVLKNW